MGSSSSRRRLTRRTQRMEDETPPVQPDEIDDNNNDNDVEESSGLAAILSYLIRSGQLHIQESPSEHEPLSYYDSSVDSDEEVDDMGNRVHTPCCSNSESPKPDTSKIDVSDLHQEVVLRSGRCDNSPIKKSFTLSGKLFQRQIGCSRLGAFSKGDQCLINSSYLPNEASIKATYRNKAFCGTYSVDGNIFITACQDQKIRIYDTKRRWKLLQEIQARDVGWSILDTAFSHDGNYVVYSSWSDNIHLCNVYGDNDIHTSLHLCPGDSRFCIFSLMFSQDNREILGGASDKCMYVYDRESNQRTLQITAHDDDVNAVVFADATSHILFSGGDDGLVKVWDRRALSEENPHPVGVFAGHHDGITYIDTKNDGRYLISNSKDQSIKLWDMRKFSSEKAQQDTQKSVGKQQWDYRWQRKPTKVRHREIDGDTSLMTYRGHTILHTLIRCRFSPEVTTGQRYIYTGCASGALIVYDLLTGEVVSKLKGHRACVRDVSWHPYENNIVSTSWDGVINKWSYHCEDSSSDLDSDSDTRKHSYMSGRRPRGQRRSERLRARFQQDGLFGW